MLEVALEAAQVILRPEEHTLVVGTKSRRAVLGATRAERGHVAVAAAPGPPGERLSHAAPLRTPAGDELLQRSDLGPSHLEPPPGDQQFPALGE
jgi:hypothetical protein